MTNLDRLIAELCPDGVEYKTLGEIATDMYRGAGIKRDEVTETGDPCVRYGEIYTTYGIWFDECVSKTQSGTKPFGYGDILFAITGERVEEIAKSCAYIGHERCYAGGDIVVIKHEQNPKYLSYALSTVSAQEQKSKGRVKSKVVHSSVPALKAIKTPVPPLPIQSKIVEVLDNFTELTARKKQYEYYRSQLLTQSATPKVAMSDISLSSSTGVTPLAGNADYYEDGTIPWLRTQEVRFVDIWDTEIRVTEKALKETSLKWVPADSVIVAISGATAGRVGINKIPLTTNQHCCCFQIDPDKAMYRYVFHCLSNANEEILSLKQGARGDLNAGMLRRFSIPLPSLNEQARIVTILDKFDSLTTDITAGLPAEIAARQKQYEYYRDKLLTFEEME